MLRTLVWITGLGAAVAGCGGGSSLECDFDRPCLGRAICVAGHCTSVDGSPDSTGVDGSPDSTGVDGSPDNTDAGVDAPADGSPLADGCVPNCGSNECGVDSTCGVSCGECLEPLVCTATNVCCMTPCTDVYGQLVCDGVWAHAPCDGGDMWCGCMAGEWVSCHACVSSS